MALKSNREGLRKESVDYLGNLIIGGKIKEDIIKLVETDLLWANVNSSSIFPSQVINIDGYIKYKYLFIVFSPSTSRVGDRLRNGAFSVITVFNDNKWYYFDRVTDASVCRYVRWNNNDLVFSNGYDGANKENNSLIIPNKIYGVK